MGVPHKSGKHLLLMNIYIYIYISCLSIRCARNIHISSGKIVFASIQT